MPEIIQDKVSNSSIIMAIGVGGGGGNAVNHLYTYGDKDVSFMLCNTDRQALINSPIPDQYKIQLGKDGLGAGNEASSGKALAEASVDAIKEALISSGIKMAFVVAGMGGGTGTGAAPIVAKVAKEMGILTIGVVTIPFEEEGRHRIEQAIAGVDELSKNVDSLIIINNSHIVEMYGDLPMSKAYFQSNEIISKAVKSISDIINKHFLVNVDFADVCKVMRDSGVALMGTGIAVGENRALEATEQALTSPLLHNQDIRGAKNALVCLMSSEQHEIKMSDAYRVPRYIQERAKTMNETDVIWGAGFDNSLEDKIQVIVIATGFNVQNIPAMKEYYSKTLRYVAPEQKEEQKGPKTINLDDEGQEAIVNKNKIQFVDDDSERRVNLEDDTYQNSRPSNKTTSEDDEFYVVSNNSNSYESSENYDSGRTIVLDDDIDENTSVESVSEKASVNIEDETVSSVNSEMYPDSEKEIEPEYDEEPNIGYDDDPELPEPPKQKRNRPSKFKSALSQAKGFFEGMLASKEEDETL